MRLSVDGKHYALLCCDSIAGRIEYDLRLPLLVRNGQTLTFERPSSGSSKHPRWSMRVRSWFIRRRRWTFGVRFQTPDYEHYIAWIKLRAGERGELMLPFHEDPVLAVTAIIIIPPGEE